MLLKILGWIWIVSGIIFFLKPIWFRDRIRKKSYKRIRGYLFAVALCVSVLLIKEVWGEPGILSKVIMIFGIIGIFKAFFFLKAKAADKLLEWFANSPLKVFRLFAALQITVGWIILKIK